MMGRANHTGPDTPPASFAARVQPYAHLLSNAGFLTAGTSVSAALGFVFWWFAARYVAPANLGLAAAAISVMNFLALLSEAGFHTMLMGQRPDGRERTSLVGAALLAAVGSAIVVACAFLSLAPLLAPHLHSLLESWPGFSLFLVGICATAFMITLDGAMVGLLLSSFRMVRECLFAVLRLALLALLVLVVPAPATSTVVAAWILALLLSLAFVIARLVLRFGWPQRPRLARLKPRLPEALSHHVLNFGAIGPTIVLPFVVAEIVSPAANAVFYVAWMLLQTLLLAPGAIATSLFAVGAADPDRIKPQLRMSLALSLGVTSIGALAYFMCLRPILEFFHPSYSGIGGPSLKYLGFSMFAIVIKYHFIAVMRVRKQLVRTALVLLCAALLELALAAGGGAVAGITGFCIGWMVAAFLQAALYLPQLAGPVRTAIPRSAA